MSADGKPSLRSVLRAYAIAAAVGVALAHLALLQVPHLWGWTFLRFLLAGPTTIHADGTAAIVVVLGLAALLGLVARRAITRTAGTLAVLAWLALGFLSFGSGV